MAHRFPIWTSIKNLLILIGLIQLIVSVTPLTCWWARLLTGPWPSSEGEILIVLGGEQVEGGVLGGSSYWRTVHAIRIWKQGKVKGIFLSGGRGSTGEPSVAAQMKQFMQVAGVPIDVIQIEERSFSTRDNALAISRELKHVAGRKLLLTSDFHMVRASHACRRAGLAVIPCPAPDANKQYLDWKGRWTLALRLAEESCKLAYYAIRGWI